MVSVVVAIGIAVVVGSLFLYITQRSGSVDDVSQGTLNVARYGPVCPGGAVEAVTVSDLAPKTERYTAPLSKTMAEHDYSADLNGDNTIRGEITHLSISAPDKNSAPYPKEAKAKMSDDQIDTIHQVPGARFYVVINAERECWTIRLA